MSTTLTEINSALQQDRFRDQMRVFADWKAELTQTIKDYQDWLNTHQLGSPEIELRIYDALEALNSDKLTIAFVAEFSRGKSELINAIFFADYGRRLLPSEAGRTTMCPTELFYDQESQESYVRLLPIETRLSDISLSDLKAEPSYWKTLPLDVNTPDQMAKTFEEVIKTKRVPYEEAERLGLTNAEGHDGPDSGKEASDTSVGGAAPKEVEIPQWRHAIISFPHPLLQQGLVVLDTPGLNALGSEPELTLNMLPRAQAILFILSADTGVTRSDLDMWKNHIKAFRNKQQSGLVAVLNKIDILWDEMKEPDAIEASIQEQSKSSARMLGIDAGNVFPVSAQKALLAKIRNNKDLLAQSKLPALESLLAVEILPARQRVIWDNIVSGLDQAIDNTYNPIASQLDDLVQQIKELSSMSGKSDNVVRHLLEKAKQQKAVYYESVKNFQSSRRKLAMQAKIMFNTIGMETIDDMINKTRKEMSGSWTTMGLKNGMSVFFDSARDAMQIAGRHSEQTFKVVLSIYDKFEKEHGLHINKPHPFPIRKYSDELDQLYLQAEEYRNSTLTTVTEQSFVIKNFFVSLVSHARNVFSNANAHAENWLKELINPLVNQIQEKRERIDQHMATLTKLKESKESLKEKMQQLQSQRKFLDEQVKSLQKIRESLQHCTPPEIAESKTKTASKEAVH